MYKCKHKDCIYCRQTGSGSGGGIVGSLCNYMLDTGEPRNCPADNCDKYTPRKRRRKKRVVNDG